MTALLCLCGCSLFSAEDTEPFSAAFTIRTTAKPTEIFFDVPYKEDTQVSDDANKTISGDALNFNDLRRLFSASLFSGEGDTTHLWHSQIRYCLQGNFTAWDTNAVAGVSRELVGVAGFPGMRQTTESDANVFIRFTQDVKGNFTYECDGADVMRSAVITIPERLSSDQRQAMIEQYLMHLCGFFHTTETPLDSVLSNDPASALTEVDLMMLDILYGEMQAGMTRDVCMHAFDAHFKQ